MRRLSLLLVAASALIGGCIFESYPTHPVVVSTPANFDRSWDAAVGAAQDVGVQLTLVDRTAGNITGTKGGAAVRIELRQLVDNSVQVKFSAPDSTETNPKLGDLWLNAYHKRMGR
jgi:hypothetical protein